mmetsp:Transcript_58842/g.157276  ORF Transcript_58842/g.157276 Transcript_58842/m.157276 type:complete len:87 (+) Transcript_58842:198-458(+)
MDGAQASKWIRAALAHPLWACASRSDWEMLQSYAVLASPSWLQVFPARVGAILGVVPLIWTVLLCGDARPIDGMTRDLIPRVRWLP